MKNKYENIDVLLKNALPSIEKPDQELVHKVKYPSIKEEPILKKSNIKASFRMAAVAVTLFLIITSTAFAAWHLLSPSEVADQLKYPTLSKAFLTDDAQLVNETKTQNGFEVSFLGIVSGKRLIELDDKVNAEKTYAVVAIAKQSEAKGNIDNDDIEAYPFFVSPIIHGQKPWLYNIASMNGGFTTCMVDGVLYRLIECDDLSIFADRGLSLIVSSSSLYDVNAYHYDEATGLVTPNPDYDGVNLLFELPLDRSKADFNKAKQYLDTLWADGEGNDLDSDRMDKGNDNKNSKSIKDNEKEPVLSRTMTYEEYQSWMESELAETEKLVEKGVYSKASLELDRSDYEGNLKAIEEGATLTMIQFEDGRLQTLITYPDTGFSVEYDNENGMVIND